MRLKLFTASEEVRLVDDVTSIQFEADFVRFMSADREVERVRSADWRGAWPSENLTDGNEFTIG